MVRALVKLTFSVSKTFLQYRFQQLPDHFDESRLVCFHTRDRGP